MSWRDQLLPASFRSVPFFVESAELTTGRRSVRHEIPFSEAAPFSQDLGARAKGYPLECYVIGAEYMTARDALLGALAVVGPGELVHPYLGTKRVQVGSVRVRHEAREGGICRFSIEFDETSAEVEQPSVTIDAPAQVAVSAAALKTAAAGEFLAKFDELSNLRDSVTGAITAATDAVSTALERAAMPGQTLAGLVRQVAGISSDVGALIDNPGSLVTLMTDLIESLAGGLVDIEAANPLTPLLSLFSADFGTRPPGDTPARLVEQVNFDATKFLIQRLVLAQASLTAIAQTFVTYDDAVAARAAITDLLDVHTDEVADDVFPALQDSRRDLVQAVPGESTDLPRLVRHTPRATLPSLVLAHTLYGNLDLEEDLIRRNRISNPGFIVGGVELEVLSDG